MESASSRNLEYFCRKCGEVASKEEYKLNPFCPNQICLTKLNQRPLPKYWIFQFNPKIYRWFDRINFTTEPEQWLTSQHAKFIHKADLVAIWASGKESGFYALGKILANPSKNPLKADQYEYWTDKSTIYKFPENNSVIIEYLKINLKKPILEDTCHNDPVLQAYKSL